MGKQILCYVLLSVVGSLRSDAFEYCERHKKQDGSPRQRVLMCDKSNAMTHADGLWQRVAPIRQFRRPNP